VPEGAYKVRCLIKALEEHLKNLNTVPTPVKRVTMNGSKQTRQSVDAAMKGGPREAERPAR
jgi:hypothetical protein